MNYLPNRSWACLCKKIAELFGRVEDLEEGGGGGGGGGAPVNAKYIVQTADATLTNEQALASLSTGILKNTTGTGVLSIATGSDLPSHTHTLADITGDGTMATQDATNVAITGGSLTDVTVTTGAYSSRVNEALMHSVRKASAGTITKGQVVRITGSSGTHLLVELADASVEATSASTIGIAATSITTTAGVMMIGGELTGLSNVPTATFTNGASLWLSETTGDFTTTRPTQPAHGVFLGWVVEANNGSSGRIYVKVINGQELEELHDVLISGLADKHILVYDGTAQVWKNQATTSAIKLDDLATPDDNTDLNATTTYHGLLPKLGGGTTNYLRADGTWATPPGTGGGGAPTTADYLVKTADGTLSAERVVTDSTSVTANWATSGQVAFERAALTGDVTASANSNSTTIANDAVTYAKMQNVSATSRVLGRKSSGSGDTEECTLSEVLDFVGSAAQGDILYRGASSWTRLAAGTSGHYLKTLGSGADPAWAAVSASGGGTKTLAVFTPMTNQPPAANFATLDTRNSIAVLDFDDGATNEEAVWVGMIPEAAVLTSGIIVRIVWMATSATSGNCRWGVQFERGTTDLDSDSFDTATEAHSAANGTSGITTTTEITATSIDSLAAGEQFRIKVYRDSSDTTNDTMTGDAELVSVELRSAN